jgi:hypothetical protein
MAAHRPALVAAGGFDERLGPGSHFGNSEDTELTYRLLRRGYSVVHTPATAVTHHGGRPYASGAAREVVLRSYYSFGAMCGRAVRRGDVLSALPFIYDGLESSWNVTSGLATGRRPLGARRLPALVGGFRDGVRDGSPRHSQAAEAHCIALRDHGNSSPAATLRT